MTQKKDLQTNMTTIVEGQFAVVKGKMYSQVSPGLLQDIICLSASWSSEEAGDAAGQWDLTPQANRDAVIWPRAHTRRPRNLSEQVCDDWWSKAPPELSSHCFTDFFLWMYLVWNHEQR